MVPSLDVHSFPHVTASLKVFFALTPMYGDMLYKGSLVRVLNGLGFLRVLGFRFVLVVGGVILGRL